MNATELGAGAICRFEDLAIGESFRFAIPFPRGVFFKTGPESYGIAPGEAMWDARDIVGVVRKHRTSNIEHPSSSGVLKIDFGEELPPLPGSGALKEAA
jgi:hypothetical protein